MPLGSAFPSALGGGDGREHVLVVLLAIALLLALVFLARGWGGGWVRRRRARARIDRAVAGEREAARLLEASGFTIEGFQIERSYVLEVDGAPVVASVRADYVVSRGGEHFVAEVKTGRVAPKIETTATRRQLLEYEHAFAVSGVLLVDAEAGVVRRVVFKRARRSGRWPLWALAAFVAAVIVVAARAT